RRWGLSPRPEGKAAASVRWAEVERQNGRAVKPWTCARAQSRLPFNEPPGRNRRPTMRRPLAVLLATVTAVALVPAPAPRGAATRTQAATDSLHFESGQVHPLALTPDGKRLLAVNTADDQLTVFSLLGPVPSPVAEIPVGLEPVSVAVRSNG